MSKCKVCEKLEKLNTPLYILDLKAGSSVQFFFPENEIEVKFCPSYGKRLNFNKDELFEFCRDCDYFCGDKSYKMAWCEYKGEMTMENNFCEHWEGEN